jgi:putative DNA primase/helicase
MVWSGKNKDVPRFAAPLMGQELLKEFPAAKDAGGLVYAYHDDAWRPDGEEFYRARVKQRMGSIWKPAHGNDVMAWIDATEVKLDPTPPLDRIRVANGILHIDFRRGRWIVTLRPHNPDPLTPVALPVTYDRAAKCPLFDTFMLEALTPGPRQTAQEIMGVLLVPDNSQQKAFLAKGDGGNGKSVWVRVIYALLGGAENCAAHELSAISDNRFAAADLYGKLANVCADISSRELSSSSLFRAITGGDPIMGEHKYKNAFTFTPYARLLFSANKFPPIANPSNALWDRWLVLTFDARFRGTAREDRKLPARLTTPEELSGILNYALAGLLRYRKQDGFTISRSSRAALDEFKLAADTVRAFIADEMTRPQFYERHERWLKYQVWCSHTGHQSLARNQFYRRMREVLGKELTVAGERGWRIK